STIDTARASITVSDYFAADLPAGGKTHRATARINVTLSRALRMTAFDLSLDTEGAPVKATGEVLGDSILVLATTYGAATPDTQRIVLTGPILLPTLIPIAVALAETPKVGKHYILPIFDPSSMSAKDIGVDIRGESTFVVNDSSALDRTTGVWHGVQPDSLRAWRVVAETGGGFSGWVDEQGHIVETSLLGFELKRMPYEVAFDNWRTSTAKASVSEGRDILETTAIAANKRLDARVNTLRVRLTNVDLTGFDLDGAGQRLIGDTLAIARQAGRALVPTYTFPEGFRIDRADTSPEPLIQSTAPAIRTLVARLLAGEKNPAAAARIINQWVHDSISDRVTFGVPSALQVLESRTGDCNEHTQLFVAMARAAGIPARIAAGLAYVDGKFYYHAWPEILLGDWVPVDPTFGQFPADASHLRFVIGGLTRQTGLLRLMGNLNIDVLSVNGAGVSHRASGGK
ncbi:MAG: transglutaminase-like domain-containing protein, partial [Gemmatimonadaceae bacterium]